MDSIANDLGLGCTHTLQGVFGALNRLIDGVHTPVATDHGEAAAVIKSEKGEKDTKDEVAKLDISNGRMACREIEKGGEIKRKKKPK